MSRHFTSRNWAISRFIHHLSSLLITSCRKITTSSQTARTTAHNTALMRRARGSLKPPSAGCPLSQDADWSRSRHCTGSAPGGVCCQRGTTSRGDGKGRVTGTEGEGWTVGERCGGVASIALPVRASEKKYVREWFE